MKVIYKGDHAEVVVPVTATSSISAKWGKPVDVPDALGKTLLESAAWIKASKEAIRKADADEATASNEDEKGAN